MIITFPKYKYNPSLIESMIDKIITLDRHDYPEINSNGTKRWFNSEGKIHRENGPAVIWTDGTVCYYQDGKRHREDGPAIIWYNGDEEYWEYGKRIK